MTANADLHIADKQQLVCDVDLSGDMTTAEKETQTPPGRVSWYLDDEQADRFDADPPGTLIGMSMDRINRARLAGWRAYDFMNGATDEFHKSSGAAEFPQASTTIERRDRYWVLVRGCQFCKHTGVTQNEGHLKHHIYETQKMQKRAGRKAIYHGFPTMTECKLYWNTSGGGPGNLTPDKIPDLPDHCKRLGGNLS